MPVYYHGKVLLATFVLRIRWNRGNTEERKDVRTEVEDTFHGRQVHELAESPHLCNLVRLNRFPHKLDDRWYAHTVT